MSKKAMIIVSLVRETSEIPNDEIEKDIFKELQKYPLLIPWADKILMVRITEE